jgi:signal peptidase I
VHEARGAAATATAAAHDPMSLTARALGRPVRASMPGFRRVVIWAAVAVAFGAWFAVLRPDALGGPATFVMVTGHSMEPVLHAGDLVITREAGAYVVGDVVAYRVPDGEAAAGRLVIHRIVGLDADGGYVLQGDNAPMIDRWRPSDGQIAGRMWLSVPGGAAVIEALRQPLVVAGLATIAWLAYAMRLPSRGPADDPSRVTR